MSMPVMPSSPPVAALLPDAAPGIPADESLPADATPFASLLQEKIGQAAELGKDNVDPFALLLPETEVVQEPSAEALPPLFAMLSAPDAISTAVLAASRPTHAAEAKTGKALLTTDLLSEQKPQAKPGIAEVAIADTSAEMPETFAAATPAHSPAKPATSFDALVQAAANLAVGPDAEKPLSQQQFLAHADLAQPQSAAFTPLSEKSLIAPAPVADMPREISTPVGHEGWAEEVGDRLVWMSKGQESRAELVLTPPHLGKIEISVNMNGEQASITFVSSNPAVREALENAMNRLREVLAEGGIQLGQANVGAESFNSHAHERKNGDHSGSRLAHADVMADGIHTSLAAWGSHGNGMVDTFA